MPAARTAESVRPAQGEQIVATGFFGGETRLELKQIARVILHEATYYILGSPESSGYPTYIYYYFVAKYLSENIYRQSVSAGIRTLVSRLTATLHVEEHANITIFFLYLTKDEESIRTLLERAKSLYVDASPCNFESDVKFTQDLITERPEMRLEDGDTTTHKKEHRSELDKADHETDERLALEEENQLEGVIRLNEAFKTIQIMGQVLRNFPGSLDGDSKLAIAKESYLLGLRVLGFFCGLVSSNMAELRVVFKEMLREQGLSDAKKLEANSRFPSASYSFQCRIWND